MPRKPRKVMPRKVYIVDPDTGIRTQDEQAAAVAGAPEISVGVPESMKKFIKGPVVYPLLVEEPDNDVPQQHQKRRRLSALKAKGWTLLTPLEKEEVMRMMLDFLAD